MFQHCEDSSVEIKIENGVYLFIHCLGCNGVWGAELKEARPPGGTSVVGNRGLTIMVPRSRGTRATRSGRMGIEFPGDIDPGLQAVAKKVFPELFQ